MKNKIYQLHGFMKNYHKHSNDYRSLYQIAESQSTLKTVRKNKPKLTSNLSYLTRFLLLFKSHCLNVIVLSLISSIMYICYPLFSSAVLLSVGNQSDGFHFGQIFWISLLFFTFKFLQMSFENYLHFSESNLGQKLYAFVLYHLLKLKQIITGNYLTIIQEDVQKMNNIPYALQRMVMNCGILIGITILLIIYCDNIEIFLSIMLLLMILLQIGCGYCSFLINIRQLSLKDLRLNTNLQSGNEDSIRQQRQHELKWIKYFLYLQFIVKSISGVVYLLYYAISITNTQSSSRPLIIIIMTMLRSPLQQISLATTIHMECIASIRRIINQHKQYNINRNINLDTQQLHHLSIQNNCEEQYNVQSQQKQQQHDISKVPNILQNQNVSFQQQNQNHIQQKSQNDCVRSQIIPIYKPIIKQEGQIKIKRIGSFIRLNYSYGYLIIALIILLVWIGAKVCTISANRAILNGQFSIIQILMLSSDVIVSLIFYLLIIHISIGISRSVFNLINLANISHQSINRLSADIRSLDKITCINGFQICSCICSFIANVIYSICVINSIFYLFLFLILSAFIFLLCLFLNRYFLYARRQILRQECRQRSLVLYCVCKQQNIRTKKQFRKYWRRLYEYKWVGLIVEIILIVLSSSFIYAMQVLWLAIILGLKLQNQLKNTLIISFFQTDLTNFFIVFMRFQLGLISFERCLNLVNDR